jgi:hypothetical protein
LGVACSSSSSGGSTSGTSTSGGSTSSGGTDPAPPAVTQTIGVAGGTVRAQGVVLDIPPGALASDTPISITPSANPIPPGYSALSQLFAFSPDGTAFQKPATATFTLSSATASPAIYWSNAAGGYDALATTASDGTHASASILHFSQGFAADATPIGTPPDAGSDSGGSDGGAPAGITATVDGVTTTFAANAFSALGTGTTIVRADDNTSSTHWSVVLFLTGTAQEACQPNGNPYITYTHYTNGTADAVYSTKTASGVCDVALSNNPKNIGDYAVGTFTGTVGVVNAPASMPQTHVFGNATFNAKLLPAA